MYLCDLDHSFDAFIPSVRRSRKMLSVFRHDTPQRLTLHCKKAIEDPEQKVQHV